MLLLSGRCKNSHGIHTSTHFHVQLTSELHAPDETTPTTVITVAPYNTAPTNQDVVVTVSGQAGSQSPELTKVFSDHAYIPQWAVGYVYEAARKGVIEGDGERFYPGEHTTRAETVIAILRLISLKR
ncbi:hypothetical protein BVG16_00415 [Paenibacillus selenitireducens]|uniref:SLH domain-containing protein n=1 Tax=Paenibacillus selenitireducens TaxID=1324314 RepID=A0A1T2XLX1_9BACL|nr:S-layer homology domain-containing protein [Paenibacillus selenitireducens]OPA80851.1 hypothetical protein BVG16_00415 [Paenibacillus selenitireducens]